MKFLSVLTVPAAFALIVASTTSAAQDKPATAPAAKPSATTAAPAKAAKPTWQGTTQLKNTLTTVPAERSGAKPSLPELTRTAPEAEGGYKSCHGKDSDA